MILFFGAVADAIGTREVELSVEDGGAARSVIDQLSQDHPALKNQNVLIAVNEEYANADTIIHDGDEIALFTAVSGG